VLGDGGLSAGISPHISSAHQMKKARRLDEPLNFDRGAFQLHVHALTLCPVAYSIGVSRLSPQPPTVYAAGQAARLVLL
jgi:hypothetical protein